MPAVLLVSSDDSTFRDFERALAGSDLEPISADEGETALMAYEIEKPVAVMVADELRDRRGLDLVETIRARPDGAGVPIVILVASPRSPAAMAAAARRKGVTACVGDGVDTGHLRDAILAAAAGDLAPLQALGASPAAEPTGGPHAPDAVTEEEEPPSSSERRGALSTLPFAQLLSDLHFERATGSLELVREKVKKTIYLRHGSPVCARSNAIGETLGAVLVKMGKITEEQRAESRETSLKTKKRHGEVLVEMGLISAKDVSLALQAQARAKVINCFGWDDGTFLFRESEEVPGDDAELRMPFAALVASGVKQRYDLPRLIKVLDPHLASCPRFLPERAAALAEMRLEQPERRLVGDLDGRRPLVEVLASSPLDELATHRLLVSTFFSRTVAFVPFDEPAPASARRTTPKPAAPRPPATSREVATKVQAAITRMSQQDFYERLGLSPGAADASVKAAFQRLAKDYDPDLLAADGGEAIRTKADTLYAMLFEAFQTLVDPVKRRKYDDDVIRGKTDETSDAGAATLNAEHQFLKGERLLKAGNVAKAHEAFKAAYDLYPNESEYQACFGWTLFKLHFPSDAATCAEGEDLLRRAIKANGRNDKAYLYLGSIAKLRGDLDEAKRRFEKALEISPENADAKAELRAVANALAKAGK